MTRRAAVTLTCAIASPPPRHDLFEAFLGGAFLAACVLYFMT